MSAQLAHSPGKPLGWTASENGGSPSYREREPELEVRTHPQGGPTFPPHSVLTATLAFGKSHEDPGPGVWGCSLLWWLLLSDTGCSLSSPGQCR